MKSNTLNIMFSRSHHSYHLFVLNTMLVLGLTMSSCSSDDEFDSQKTKTEGHSTFTQTSNIGIALNNFNAGVLQASVISFTRSVGSEQAAKAYASISSATAWSSQNSDGGLTCDVTWDTPCATRGNPTGYTLQWENIGAANQIAIQPRNYAATQYGTYTVTNTGAISATTPYYFETANNDVITSWYPYSNDLASFAVKPDQSSLERYIASDLLYTSAVVSAASQSLTYSHKMAQIIIDVTVSNANYLTNSLIQSLTISGLKTNCTPGFTTSNNTATSPNFSATGSATPIKAYRIENDNKTTDATKSTATFIMCVPAQEISATQIFTITVGGTDYTGKLTNPQTLASGCAYNVSVAIDGKATMIYPSGSIAYGDFYGVAGNGQGVVIKNGSANVTNAKAKGITPIAMVFHTTTSTSDRSSAYHDAWTHGYAMSLKKVEIESGGCHWSISEGIVQSKQYGDGNISDLTAEINRVKANLDGYSETKSILAKTSNTPSMSYPACYYAVTYSVTCPKSSSGWYLPSVGQIYYLFHNSNSTTYSLIKDDGKFSNTRIGISYDDGSIQDAIISNKLSALSETDYTWTTQKHIWLSSESSSNYALIFYFGTAPIGLWYVYPHYLKTVNNSGVRPFIAF